jgi:fructokinase
MARMSSVSPPPSAVAGMGRITLDVVISPGLPPRAQAGGTCGNVLANLAFLGWRSVPIARLGDDGPGRIVRADLARCGVDLSLLRLAPEETTPVIAHHVPNVFSCLCPFCGRRLPDFNPMPLADAEAALALAPPCGAFLFDWDSPGSLLVARHFRQAGALVVWEPNYAGPEVDLAAALSVAHVVKCSAAELPGFAESAPAEVPLVVETHGEAGLRYRHCGHWHELPAFSISPIRDAAGAGDWVTAATIHVLAQTGVSDEGPVREALRLGQAFAAYNCAFEGARGACYAVSRERLLSDVARMLSGSPVSPETDAAPALEGAGRFCPCREA